jgi:hypothetical protein
MSGKTKIVADAEGKFIAVNGIKYYPVRWSYRKTRGHHIVYEQVDEAAREKMKQNLIKAFSKKLTTEQILNEVLNRVEFKQLVKLNSLLKKKKKVRVTGGCINIELGNQNITIV